MSTPLIPILRNHQAREGGKNVRGEDGVQCGEMMTPEPDRTVTLLHMNLQQFYLPACDLFKMKSVKSSSIL